MGRSFADDDSTLASIRKGDSKGGEFSPRKNLNELKRRTIFYRH